jgi:hypothetical protein
MPRIPTDYSKALIYKIVCNDIKIKECYYGSTTNFKARKCHHKSSCNNINSINYNEPKYQFIRENGGWNNWKIVLIKYYPCNTKLELEREERLCMEQDENRLNTQLPAKTDDEKKQYGKEWREENKEYIKKYRIENAEKIKERQKQYRIENAETKKEYQKQYKIDNAETTKEYQKEYQKQYRIENAEKRKEYRKQYYLKNKK